MNIRKPWKQTPSYKGEEKAESYNFFDISSFFRFDTPRNALGVLSDQTCSDLGFRLFPDLCHLRKGIGFVCNVLFQFRIQLLHVDTGHFHPSSSARLIFWMMSSM